MRNPGIQEHAAAPSAEASAPSAAPLAPGLVRILQCRINT